MAGNQFKSNELGGLSYGAVYTDEQYPLGTTALQLSDDVDNTAGGSAVDTDLAFALLQGDREWVFVYAKEAITAGDLCEWDFDHGIAYAVEPSDADDSVVQLLAGVADNDIAAGSYGWICKKGTVVVAATGSTGGALLASVAAGGVDAGGAAGTSVGVGLEDAGATKVGFAQAYINIP